MANPFKAVRLDLLSLRTPQMRAFHMSWFAFFLCFFAWFGIAPLMSVVRQDLGLTKHQVGNTIIASVGATIFARPVIGWLSDRFGPRRTYSWLLILGSIPVMGAALVSTYEQLFVARLAIGVIGASFVITQHHTSLMFASNCVGTANATSAGWGNLGGGVAQLVMPLLLGLIISFGVAERIGWRIAVVLPGVALLGVGIAYRFVTQDTPAGNLAEQVAESMPVADVGAGSSLRLVAGDYRVWTLFLIYAACFGVELTINNVAAMYFYDSFGLGLAAAGLAAASFGLMNVFARTVGGYVSDRLGIRFGLRGRVGFMGVVLLGEGLALIAFSRADLLVTAIPLLIAFSLFVQMTEGATFALVPLINKRAIGTIAGIVGAGGNVGAVAAGFLFRSEALSTQTAFLYTGLAVCAASGLALMIRFSARDELSARRDMNASLARRQGRLELAS